MGLGTVSIHGRREERRRSCGWRRAAGGPDHAAAREAVTGWNVGDKLVIPDTRQLRQNERGDELQAAVGRADHRRGRRPHDHARGAAHLRPRGRALGRRRRWSSCRTSATSRATSSSDPRTRPARAATRSSSRTPTSTSATRCSRTWAARAWASSTTPSSTRTAPVRRVGTNQIGRYAIHFHHAFGPKTTPANGYQFTLIGNAV